MTSPFYKGTNLQFAWNSSALSVLKDCPRKYQLKYIDCWTPKGESLHLRFGTLYHRGLELYDVFRNDGASPDDALDAVVAELLEVTWDNREPDGTGGAPWEVDRSTPAGSKKNRETLIRSVIWYIDHYRDDPTETVILSSGKPGLELTFTLEVEALTPRGEPYLFTGHMDRLVNYGGDLFVMDRKTSGATISPYFFDKFNPDNQMSLYTLASRLVYDVPVSGVIIDAAQIAVGFTAFSRGLTMRSEGQLNEWLADVGYWLKAAEHYAEQGYWPMNDNSCHKYDGCEFRRVCRMDPAVRRNYLETDFVRDTHVVDRILEGDA